MILIIFNSNLDAFEHGIIPAVVKHIPIDSNVAELYSGKYYVAWIILNYYSDYLLLWYASFIYFHFLPSSLFSIFFAASLRILKSHLIPFYFTSLFILFYFILFYLILFYFCSLSSSFLSIFLYFHPFLLTYFYSPFFLFSNLSSFLPNFFNIILFILRYWCPRSECS